MSDLHTEAATRTIAQGYLSRGPYREGGHPFEESISVFVGRWSDVYDDRFRREWATRVVLASGPQWTAWQIPDAEVEGVLALIETYARDRVLYNAPCLMKREWLVSAEAEEERPDDGPDCGYCGDAGYTTNIVRDPSRFYGYREDREECECARRSREDSFEPPEPDDYDDPNAEVDW